jgi:hypothetical protein
MSYLSCEAKGIPIAKVCSFTGNNKIISIVDPSIEEKSVKKCCKKKSKKCCKKCKGIKCKGGCCKNCCNYQNSEESDEESEDEQSTSESSGESSEELDLDLLDTKYYRQMKMPYRVNVEKLKSNIKNKKVDKKIYNETKKYVKDKQNKEILIHEGEIQPLPKYNERECIYVAGPSGSGKSTYIAAYASEYLKMFPGNKLFVFSRVANDECIDQLKPIRVMINEELIEDPISPQELANSLVIFDDTDTIPNKKLKDVITALKNDLLETGRHEDIYVAITSHLITNYRETRTVLNECHSITLFPAGGSTYSIKYVLKNYGGMDKNDIEKAIGLPSRWITLKKTYPQCIIYAKGIYLLSKI